ILVFFILFILMILCPLRSTLFPYTTLFRSSNRESMGTLGWSCGTELVWMVSQGAAGDRFAKRSPAAPCETEYSSNYTFEHIFSRSEEHTSELQSPYDIVCRLLLEKKKNTQT